MRYSRLIALLLALLAGCDRTPAPVGEQAGRGLEQAALAHGLIASTSDPVGLYASDTDRLCITRAPGGDFRVGATIDFGPEHRCRAIGTATGAATLRVRLADDCRFTARFDGERIAFPPVLPAGCDRACTGRASLAALTADRLSASPSEIAATTGDAAAQLCAP